MKNYTITVNGNVYDVTVEEKGAGAVPALQTGSESSSGSESGTCSSGKSSGRRKHSGESRRGRKSIPDPDKRRSECSTG